MTGKAAIENRPFISRYQNLSQGHVTPLIAEHRTLSTWINSYMRPLRNPHYNELFLQRYQLISGTIHVDFRYGTGWDSQDEIKKKFRWLFEKKHQGEHVHFKVFPFSLMKRGFEEDLVEYLSGYKVLTIKRNPLDTFLSFSYQQQTGWRRPHRKIHHEPLDDVMYRVPESVMKLWCESHRYTRKFISGLDVLHEFDADSLDDETLENFFGTESQLMTRPMDIDYPSLIENYKEVEKYIRENV